MFSLIVPFHSDYARLAQTLPVIAKESSSHQITEVLLVHNGTPLPESVWYEIKSWAGSNRQIRYLHTDISGLGAAYRMGIEQATADYVILSSSDLHFGWTDLVAFQSLSRWPEFALGSKAHPKSKTGHRNWRRRWATDVLRLIRRILFGSRMPKDTQGSLILKRLQAVELASHCESDDYLFSLEMVLEQLHGNRDCVEIPVHLQPEIGPSNVRIFRDGSRILWGMIMLKIRKTLR